MKQCPCPAPPGGHVTCDDNQIAICRIIGGVPHSECVTPPSSLFTRQYTDEVHRWVLERITGKKWGSVTSDDIKLLESGRYIDKNTGEEVTFSLPASILSNPQTGATS